MADISIRNLDALREFYAHLGAFNQELKESFAHMRAHTQSVRDDWNDSKFQTFERAFDEVALGVERYLATTEEHEQYLASLIERMQQVLDTTM